jgi:hypothetical protein
VEKVKVGDTEYVSDLCFLHVVFACHLQSEEIQGSEGRRDETSIEQYDDGWFLSDWSTYLESTWAIIRIFILHIRIRSLHSRSY